MKSKILKTVLLLFASLCVSYTFAQMINQVCEKGVRNQPLTEEQKASNREKSRVRSRVEHIFGFMENSMNEMYIQCIGIKRATAVIGLMNLTYNMFRKIQLMAISGDNCALLCKC